MAAYSDPRWNVKPGEGYKEYASRVAALAEWRTEYFGKVSTSGVDIDKRARRLLAERGITRPDYRQYRDACAMAAAELER